MIGKNSKFKVGDKAFKPNGYKFPCTIVSVFETKAGEVRIVGEMDDNMMDCFGLHLSRRLPSGHTSFSQ